MTLMFQRYINCLNGNEFVTEDTIERYVPTKEEFSAAKQLIADFNAQELINKVELYKDFRAIAPDLSKKIGSEELFYALKNGFLVEEAPSKLIYLCRKAYDRCKCANAVPSMLSEQMLNDVFTVGYLKNGWTLSDILRTFCDARFIPLSRVGSYCQTSTGVDFLLSEEPSYAHLPPDYVRSHDISQFRVKDNKLFDEYSHEVDLNE